MAVIGSSTAPSAWPLPLPPGSWVVFAKALATGGTYVDCQLMPHSDTIAIPPSAEIDDIEVRTDTGPVAIVLTGLALTDDDITGVDLVCGSIEGTAAMGSIKVVAMQVAAAPVP